MCLLVVGEVVWFPVGEEVVWLLFGIPVVRHLVREGVVCHWMGWCGGYHFGTGCRQREVVKVGACKCWCRCSG